MDFGVQILFGSPRVEIPRPGAQIIQWDFEFASMEELDEQKEINIKNAIKATVAAIFRKVTKIEQSALEDRVLSEGQQIIPFVLMAEIGAKKNGRDYIKEALQELVDQNRLYPVKDTFGTTTYHLGFKN